MSQENDTIPLSFDPRSPAFRANPYPTYHHLRTYQPVWYRPEKKDWVLTRYADVSGVLMDKRFGRSEPELSEQSEQEATAADQEPIHRLLSLRRDSQKSMALWLVLRNPPAHTRIRDLFQKPFTPAQIQSLQGYIQARVDTLIVRMEKQGKGDIIRDFAYPLTLGINCEQLLGIPERAWHPQFNQWSENVSLVADMDITSSARERGLMAMVGLAEYFRDWIAKCRQADELQDNLVSTLIKAEAEGQLSGEELVANCVMMYTIGHSSTTNLIGLSILHLLNHPEQLHLLRAEPTLIDTAIDEVLRYDSPVQGVARTALSDVRLSGQTIHQGEVVKCLIGAANRDPDRFPEPDKFDIRRQPNPHLSFGRGIHLCIGQHLAKLVAKVAIATLMHRFPGLSLAMDADTLEWDNSFLGRGLKSLPVVFQGCI